jgi:transposase InsO family protein
MTVLTTHPGLYAQLHGRKCTSHDNHQRIEGKTRFEKHPILRTEFSESYPRKFSRLIAKVMSQSPFQRPFNWTVGAWCHVAETHPTIGQKEVRSVFRKPSQQQEKFPRSALSKPTPMHDKDEKRRRLTGKQSTEPYLEDYQSCLQKIHQVTPRVGKYQITNPQILADLQRLFPDKLVTSAVACRGTDRTLAPPEGTVPRLTPFRKALMIIRSTGEVKFETNWEKWQDLSNRQLIRPAHSCRLNVTMFAKDRDPVMIGDSQSSQSVQPDVPVAGEPEDSLPQSIDTTRADEVRPTAQPIFPVSKPMTTEQPKDVTQSASVMMLPKWERLKLMQIHKNLGHPSNERLATALRNSGQRPEMVQAAFDLVCPSCLTHTPPKHQRPGSLKPMMDFNHKIYIDGISWSNSSKKTFFFYHVLDAGSNFHTAFCAPSHTARDVIQLLSQHWISWAGYPAEITHDSGTELISEEFTQFCQQYGIKTNVTSPEAHWQNGKIERHGRFIQEMLQRIDTDLPISTYADLQVALNQCTQAKNSMIVRHGYSPEIIVFGKSSRLPGSIMSDESIPSHVSAVQEPEELHPKGFKHLLQLREAARKAFHAADNSDSIRRAMLRRPCPERGNYDPNTWVMIWRTTSSKSQEWIGPQRIILQDSNHTVWTTQAGKLYRSAPENVRLAHPSEGDREDGLLPEDITSIQQQITRMNQSLPAIPEAEEINNPIDHDNLNNPTTDQERRESDPSITSPIGQPDHEPEIESRQVSAADDAMPASESEGPDFQLLCVEESDALCTDADQNLAWKCEFDVNIPESTQVDTLSPEESCILLATSAKKQRTEVRLHELTKQERDQFEQAKAAEVANWIQTKTLTKVLRNQIPESQILRCRWILTWKPLDTVGTNSGNPAGPSHKAKARLVVLGYLDPKIEDIPIDSPTLNKTSRMLILQGIANHGWTLKSFDIKAAFLQGQPQGDRIMAVEPVPEIRKAMQMKPDEVGQLNKGAYGLIDAPFLWYKALVGELTRLGLETSPFDPCVFILRGPKNTHKEGQLLGVVGIHVDDGIYGGTPEFQQIMDKLEQKYAFGSKSSTAFTFTGIELTQKYDHSIVLSQSAYVRKIQSIPIEAHARPNMNYPSMKLKGVISGVL